MPYWRLSNFYFFYFAALGALVPYWALYLQSRGFDSLAIGELMAILMATKVVAPYIWGWLGDHLGHRMAIVRVASLLSALIFLAMYQVEGFWGIALIMALFSFFWNASLPQFEAVTFTYLGQQVSRYSRIRLWGSVGFIVAVALLGIAIDRQGPEIILSVVFALYLGIWLSSLPVKDPDPEPHPPRQESIMMVLRHPAIIAFFVAVFLMQASHGPYYVFYSIYLEDHGYSKTLIGQFWALGVVAEVLLFIVMHRLLERHGGRTVLYWSFYIAALRWLLIGWFPDSMALLLFAQVLHAATFGSFHAAAIHLVHHYFPGRHRGRGQALYSSVSFGAGGAVGSLVSGATWEPYGATLSYGMAAGAALAGGLLVWRFIGREHDH